MANPLFDLNADKRVLHMMLISQHKTYGGLQTGSAYASAKGSS